MYAYIYLYSYMYTQIPTQEVKDHKGSDNHDPTKQNQ